MTEFQVDEIPIHSDMDKPVRTVVNVTAARVEHYSDVVDFMTRDAVQRYVKKNGCNPSLRAVVNAKKEIVRLAIISRDILGAQKVDIE
jgi:hypothetical protein